MKIKPFTYNLSESAIQSVKDNTGEDQIDFKKSIKKGKSGSLIVITEEPSRMYYYTPVIYKEELYAAVFPNPVHLFLAQSIEHSKSVDSIVAEFPKNIQYVLQNEKSTLNLINDGLYYKYIIYKISAITSLIMTVESFVNSVIPDDYEFINKKDNRSIDKSKIERSLTLKEKLVDVIPQIIEIKDAKIYNKLYGKILEINSLRNEFIHLKTKLDSKNADPFIDHFESLINLDVKDKIEDVKKLICFLKPQFLE